jgi:hypothetical protein
MLGHVPDVDEELCLTHVDWPIFKAAQFIAGFNE